jgi:opacity protein-like surface antigen
MAFGAEHTDTNFAWGVYGGLAHDVTPSVTIDLSRVARSLPTRATSPITSLEINHITSNDVMLGVRWKFGCCDQAPMPVAFK